MCRFFAARILPALDRHNTLNIIPIRSLLGQKILKKKGIKEEDRTKNWWYMNEYEWLFQSNKGGLHFLLWDLGWLPQFMYWARWTERFNRFDNWLKEKRAFISRFVPNLPATFQLQGEEGNTYEIEYDYKEELQKG